jgi:His/Glu/Gln/Arg/opine family amino acid ABC transporter permease subunit
MLDSLRQGFYTAFIDQGRWMTYVQGFKVTLIIALFATLIGIAVGTVVAVIRVYHYRTGRLAPASAVCSVYVTIIRGTPVVVQLMIWYFIILVSVRSGVLIGTIGFGINSGAYVSEIMRAGILSIDKGQTEAGRSLGLNDRTTMIYIVLPQAIKNVLPALFNEFISLVKETSVVGYIAIIDLTKAADLVRAATYQPFWPLIMIAIIYLVVVLGLTAVQRQIEKRLRAGDRR